MNIIIIKSMNIMVLLTGIMLINGIYSNIVKTTCYRYKEYPYECNKNNDSYLCDMKFHSDNYSSIHIFTGFQFFNNTFQCYYDTDDESYIYINQKDVEEINISFYIIYLFIIIIFYFKYEIRT